MSDKTELLGYLLKQQSLLQEKMPTTHPRDLYQGYDGLPIATSADATEADAYREEAIGFIHWNVTALVDELHELLGEIGWKPWATSKHINLEAARGEWVDALHFLLNLAMVLGLTPDGIVSRYDAKHEKNAKRQEDGYDGVTTKCPGCHRALDDTAVNCREIMTRLGTSELVQAVKCEVLGRVFKIGGKA